MKFFLKLCCAGILALVIWEVILMNFVINTTGYSDHPILGRIAKGGISVHGIEGYSRTKLNSIGLRNSEIQSKKSDTFRILSIGDSFTQGLQVSDEETFSYLLEKELKDENNVEVINAGRPSASPAFYIHLADYNNEIFNQDYTIIQISDNDFLVDLLNTTRLFYAKEDGNSFKTVFNEGYSSNNPLLQKFPQFRDILEFSVARRGAEKFQEVLLSEATTRAASQENAINYEPVIDWVVKEMGEKYGSVVFVYLPVLDYNNISKEPSEIEKLVMNAFERHNVNFINMRDSFSDYFKKYHVPSHGFNNTIPGEGHINSTGHKLVSQKLEEFFAGRVIN